LEGLGPVGARRRRQCHHPQPTVCDTHCILAALLTCYLLDQSLEGWLEVCLIVDKERVLTQEARIQWTILESGPIALEKQPAAYQVDRTNHDRRPSRVLPPFPRFRQLPTKRANSQWS